MTAVAVRERPIIFSGYSVRRVLAGAKTQTRRVVKKTVSGGVSLRGRHWHLDDPEVVKACPYGQPLDHLYVRETFCHPGQGRTEYRATSSDDEWEVPWRPPIFMPRWASRLTLEIMDVRCERLQDISREDAKAEGFWPSWGSGLESWDGQMYGNSQLAFRACWDTLNAKRGHGWETNPWVWCLSFRQVQP